MHNQEIEFLIYDALLSEVAPSFIDIGAEKGSFSKWMLDRGLSGVAIEPMPQHTLLLKRLSENESLNFLPVAIDAEDGQRDFHIATDNDGKPLDYFHSLQPLHGDTRVHHTKTLSVTCRSLGSLCKEGAIPNHVGILKIDTEGNDLRVLQGIEEVKADLLIVEFFTEGIYSGWKDADPMRLIDKAESLGYSHCLAVRHSKSGVRQVHYQPLCFSPEEWGNLIFLNKSSYPKLRSILRAQPSILEDSSLRKVAELQQCCDDRLRVIQTLEKERVRLKTTYEPTH